MMEIRKQNETDSWFYVSGKRKQGPLERDSARQCSILDGKYPARRPHKLLHRVPECLDQLRQLNSDKTMVLIAYLRSGRVYMH